MNEEIVNAFVSYSWDSKEHQNWVMNLTNKLRKKGGVDATCDKFEIHSETTDLYSMMTSAIKDNDYVIIVLTENYAQKADDLKGGVGFETMLTKPLLQDNSEKLIFITRHDGDMDKAIPFHLKPFYVIDFSNDEDFDEKFKELLHRVYEIPLFKKASLGKKPDLEPKTIEFKEPQEKNDELIVIDNKDDERVTWLLPRGFLIFDGITYKDCNSWSVTAHYYNYQGKWQHSTHYHESYRWDDSIETQFRKLCIPIADWEFAESALKFLQELREVDSKIDIKDKVKRVKNRGEYANYYSPKEPIFLPEPPEEYLGLKRTGELRDIVKKLRKKRNKYESCFYGYTKIDNEELEYKEIERLRRRGYVLVNNYLEENNNAIKFLEEVIDKYEREMDMKELHEWVDDFVRTIVDIIPK